MDNVFDSKLDAQESNEHGYKVAVPGPYEFQVESVSGKEFIPKAGNKIGRCAEIDLKLRIEGKDEKGNDIECYCWEKLYSDQSTAWKMTAFFKSVGVYDKELTVGEMMRKSQDGIGHAEFGTFTNKKGNVQNEVKKYIPHSADNTVKLDDSENLPF